MKKQKKCEIVKFIGDSFAISMFLGLIISPLAGQSPIIFWTFLGIPAILIWGICGNLLRKWGCKETVFLGWCVPDENKKVEKQ